MNWQDVGNMVVKVAPILGASLTGPVGAVAAAAGSVLSAFLGTEPDPVKVQQALADPQTLLSLKQLEVQQQALLIDWQNKQLEAELENVKSAREREIALAQAGHSAAWGTSIVSIIVTCGFFLMLYMVIDGKKAELGEAGIMLLGTLAAGFGAVINYYLGSSSGSAAKDKRLGVK